MNLEFKEIIDSIRVLPFDEQDYLATMVLEHSDIQKHSEITSKRTVGEYIGKIEISDDFTDPLPDIFWSGESNETVA
jgi:hypothetical protein